MLKIQSVTDVITNSSSETYICVTSTAINHVHEILRKLVKAFDESYDFDSMFTIKLDIDEYDVNDIWNESYADDYTEKNLTIEQKAMIINDDICDKLEGCPVIDGITIEANNPWNKHLAEILSEFVNNPFESETFYT